MKKWYKQIVVLSGKGGTGKTTVSSSLAEIVSDKIVIDADVDASNLHLVLKHKEIERHNYSGGKKARIISEKCSLCGLCESVCRFSAIKNFQVDKVACEGCGFCYRICPDGAIEFVETKTGEYYESKLVDGSDFYYAKLLAGEGNSGKLVSELKKTAINNINPDIKWIIIDGPPGIGCPVNASLSGSDFVLIVTEPTESGYHDLKRLIELLNVFKLKAGLIINKFDINSEMSEKIAHFAKECGIPLVGKFPFDYIFVKAVQKSKALVHESEFYKKQFITIWKEIEIIINK
ncbi:MAG: ATP-binding protein [Ignavibacteriaceae bacterium]|jgi:MinD superfamily P-loop ATPase|nr:ATP-binding protein [Ignavibacteriaceae bacterium]